MKEVFKMCSLTGSNTRATTRSRGTSGTAYALGSSARDSSEKPPETPLGINSARFLTRGLVADSPVPRFLSGQAATYFLCL
jgi:hypothetical protein